MYFFTAGAGYAKAFSFHPLQTSNAKRMTTSKDTSILKFVQANWAAHSCMRISLSVSKHFLFVIPFSPEALKNKLLLLAFQSSAHGAIGLKTRRQVERSQLLFFLLFNFLLARFSCSSLRESQIEPLSFLRQILQHPFAEVQLRK